MGDRGVQRLPIPPMSHRQKAGVLFELCSVVERSTFNDLVLQKMREELHGEDQTALFGFGRLENSEFLLCGARRITVLYDMLLRLA